MNKKNAVFTEKNKKSEILDAYHNLLKELKERKSTNPKEEKEKKDNRKILQQFPKIIFS
jgi:ADP-heptose:LPS heptosyltransferase